MSAPDGGLVSSNAAGDMVRSPRARRRSCRGRELAIAGMVLLAGAGATAANGTGVDGSAVEAAPAQSTPAGSLPDLPEAVSSFGAAVAGDWLYVYGGHVGRTHEHSVDNLSSGFRRLDLQDGTGWEDLGPVKPLQGLAMVSHAGKIYRIGGMDARNRGGEEEDLHSVDDFVRYDPATGSWQDLPPLPEPRSSHDAAVLDGVLHVLGGWELRGEAEPVWHQTAWTFALEDDEASWEPMAEPPFLQRAAAVAAAAGRVWLLGGIAEEGVQTSTHYYDTRTRMWARGPDLPIDADTMGFAVAACGVDGSVHVSGADGVLYRLSADGSRWEEAGSELATPRFFHRLVSHRDEALLFVAGSGSDGHLSDIERVELASLATPDRDRLAADNTAPLAASDGAPLADGDPATDAGGTWPGFRGAGDSHTMARDLPVSWSEDENVGWIADLPGYGQSSPVVWGDRVFVTSVDGQRKDTLIVSALELESGDVLWRRRLPGTPDLEWSNYVSKAAPTPAVGTERLYAFFESGDLIALDHDGNSLWRRSLTADFGEFQGNHGIGNSIALTGDSVIVLVTHSGPSYLLAVDKASGADRWKADLEPAMAWSSPVVSSAEGRTEILVNQNGTARAFDAADGSPLWHVGGITGNFMASPSATERFVVFGSSQKGQSVAVRRGGSGDVADSHVLWRAEAGADYASPLVHGNCVLFVNSAGVLSCVDDATGDARWHHRLGDSCWASPLAAGKLAYFFSKKGTTTVLRVDSERPVEIAQNPLPTRLTADDYLYGVAAVDSAFLIRTGTRLVKVQKDSRAPVSDDDDLQAGSIDRTRDVQPSNEKRPRSSWSSTSS